MRGAEARALAPPPPRAAAVEERRALTPPAPASPPPRARRFPRRQPANPQPGPRRAAGRAPIGWAGLGAARPLAGPPRPALGGLSAFDSNRRCCCWGRCCCCRRSSARCLKRLPPRPARQHRRPMGGAGPGRWARAGPRGGRRRRVPRGGRRRLTAVSPQAERRAPGRMQAAEDGDSAKDEDKVGGWGRRGERGQGSGRPAAPRLGA